MSKIKLLKGSLLVAEPSILHDDSFNRSIILLTEHNENSSVGFILNRPLTYTVNDIIPEIDCSFKIYQGGPVEQDNLYFIHKIPELIPNSIKVSKNMYWGGNFESLKFLLQEKEIKNTQIRFFLGYTGWSKILLEEVFNQLKKEFDWSKNKIGTRVKVGGDMIAGRQFVVWYISYKNEDGINTGFIYLR